MKPFQIQGFFILGPIHPTEIGPIFYYFWQILKYSMYNPDYFFKSYFSLTSLLFLFPLRSPLSKSPLSALRSHRSVVQHEGTNSELNPSQCMWLVVPPLWFTIKHAHLLCLHTVPGWSRLNALILKMQEEDTGGVSQCRQWLAAVAAVGGQLDASWMQWHGSQLRASQQSQHLHGANKIGVR
jgi:hypothetical protein